MASKPFTDEIYANKHKMKNVKFSVQLNEEQKLAKAAIFENTITLLTGKAGSGKTLTVCQVGLDLLFSKVVNKIIITRPMVSAEEEIGFLPGNIKEKTDPYLRPIYDMISTVHNATKAEEMIADKKIEIIPFGFMRGINMEKAFVVADEAQNCTATQLKLLMTRLCINSKMVIVGDIDQCDLKYNQESGFHMMEKLEGIPGYSKIELLQNHRHPIVEQILEKLAL